MNSRHARQHFADLLDSAFAGNRIGIDRNNQIVAAVVSPAALSFLEQLGSAETVDQVIEALSLQDGGPEEGKRDFVRRNLVASLKFAVQERVSGARGLMEFPRTSEAREADGTVALMRFGDDDLVRSGWLALNLDEEGRQVLTGAVTLARPGYLVILELSDGEKIKLPAGDGTVVRLADRPVNAGIALERTKISITDPQSRKDAEADQRGK
ncbi:type II toxin-antitoxin system Phd/YefM family antitoxin [Azospirillum lipoferum]|uniref:Uncharacterized protein n=1 Tax=Azospirillum lipoferum (strain 4B) TaxID=862719 RepID=G7Z3R5_AZOL4|nr:hypothetical protein [Azospirillum lipoferum]CBS88088.1 protein of unknown function [Azospirillum lipoferum 4B]